MTRHLWPVEAGSAPDAHVRLELLVDLIRTSGGTPTRSQSLILARESAEEFELPGSVGLAQFLAWVDAFLAEEDPAILDELGVPNECRRAVRRAAEMSGDPTAPAAGVRVRGEEANRYRRNFDLPADPSRPGGVVVLWVDVD